MRSGGITISIQQGIVARAYWILPDGSYSTDAVYRVGDPIKLATTLYYPSGVTQPQPVSIQAFVAPYGSPNYTGLSIHSWDVSATGYTYILDFGSATQEMTGSWSFYTITTMSDGSRLQSNIVFVTVIPRGI